MATGPQRIRDELVWWGVGLVFLVLLVKQLGPAPWMTIPAFLLDLSEWLHRRRSP